MIDVAIIASVPHLTDLSALGSIEMALTHLVLANSAYADFYLRRSAAGVTVILDNSAYELEEHTGKGMDVQPVLAAASRIGATVVICQDVLYDGTRTLTTTRRFLDHAAGTGYRFMAVPQGETRAEWLDCYEELAALPGIDMIGLSKLSVPRCFGGPVAETRLECVEALLERGTPLPLHLLGGDRSLAWELAEHRRRDHDSVVRSNDSSFAFWYAACGIDVDPSTGRALHEAPTKPDLIEARLDQTVIDVARRNAQLLFTSAGVRPESTLRAGI